MNFLAHVHLSGDDEDLIVGNFIADAVKGNDYRDYPEGIARGIRLHREIDHFTDHHPVFLASRSRLAPRYKLYSGVIVDLYYDHFLARNWSDYSDEDLRKTVSSAYFLLIRRFHQLPARSKRILPFLVTRNWLVGYRDFDQLQSVFNGMARRTNYRSGMEHAISDLKASYADFEREFRSFYPEIIRHAADFRCNLKPDHPS